MIGIRLSNYDHAAVKRVGALSVVEARAEAANHAPAQRQAGSDDHDGSGRLNSRAWVATSRGTDRPVCVSSQVQSCSIRATT